MTSICAGLAIFGLCLPVPGHPVDSVKAAGWVNQSEEKDTWLSAHMFASNAYRIGTLVEGDQRRVTSVWLRESRSSDREAADSPVAAPLSRFVRAQRKESRAASRGYSFWRLECGGGWLLYSTSMSPERQQLQESCKRFGALLK